MAGKQKGIFSVTSSNGSASQTPSFRVRLNGVVIAAVKSEEHFKIAQWMLNNPASKERLSLREQMLAGGFTDDDVRIVLAP